jgi:hypothetical protein
MGWKVGEKEFLRESMKVEVESRGLFDVSWWSVHSLNKLVVQNASWKRRQAWNFSPGAFCRGSSAWETLFTSLTAGIPSSLLSASPFAILASDLITNIYIYQSRRAAVYNIQPPRTTVSEEK